MAGSAAQRQKIDLLIHPIGELATAEVDGGPARGRQLGEIKRVKEAAVAVLYSVSHRRPSLQEGDGAVKAAALLIDAPCSNKCRR